MNIDSLNMFYREPDPDRWLKFDRYPRRIIRRIMRGKPRPGGQAMVGINLLKGLEKINAAYKFNDFSYTKRHPDEIACIVGKPDLMFNRTWRNPVILGASIFSHPMDCPDLFERYPNVKRILVPGPWIKTMFEPFYGNKVVAWPVGIDTATWSPNIKRAPDFDFLIYDKVRWEHDRFQAELIDPLCRLLDKHRLTYQFIRYGSYETAGLLDKISKSRSCVFLCEHETQGLAYQQILSTGTPILAWDRGGYWQDPYYYPEKVQFQQVSSVPYWDERCGVKFVDADDFEECLQIFLNEWERFRPNDYIQENLTLEKCAEKYLQIYNTVRQELK